MGHIRLDSAESRPTRLYYVDWLRVLAMLSVFLYHNNRFFNSGDWHVKNGELSLVSTIAEDVVAQWMMPLLFVLSGAAVCYSFKARTAGAFVKERTLRLLVPLVSVGIFVLGPIQIYLERITHGQFTGNFFQFYPHYFDGLYGFGGNFAFHGVHLWYLMLLFLFSLLLLPLFLSGRKTGNRVITVLASPFERPWTLFLLFIPLAAASLLADAADLGVTRQMGGWDILSYIVFFVYGYLVFTGIRVAQVMGRYSLAALIAAVSLTAARETLKFGIMPTPDTGYFGSTELRALLSWCWIIAILGFGSRSLNFNNRFIGYANESVLPFYILHQPVILAVGFFVVQWSLPIPAKYLIISTGSFVIIMAVYHLLVRRLKVLRILFGMKPAVRTS